MTTQIDDGGRAALRRVLEDPIFELIPLSNAVTQSAFLPEKARVSVTASPNKTLDDSLDLAGELTGREFRVIPHLSAKMVESPDHLDHLLDRIDDIGIEAVFVVGGDGDAGGAFKDGVALVRAVAAARPDLRLGVPCYPEGHPDIADDVLSDALEAKQTHAAWMTSQMCFDPETLVSWVTEARSSGIAIPLVLGLPGAADRTKLLRISTRIGVGNSLSFLRKNTGLISSFVKPGGFDPAAILLGLGDALGDPGLNITGCHIYTFNDCEATERWRQDFLGRL